MTIGVECPHCEMFFQLAPSMEGCAIRCPNPDCRQTFIVQTVPAPMPVQDAAPSAAAPVVEANPSQSSGSVSDFLPVYDAEVVSEEPLPPPAPRNRPARQKSPAKPQPRVVRWDDAAAEAPQQTSNKEKSRSTGRGGSKSVRAPDEDDAAARNATRRARRGRMQKVLFLAATIGTIVSLAGGGWFLYKKAVLDERHLAQDAERFYTDGKFGESGRIYEELVRDYPTSEDVDKYRFFARLSTVQTAASTPTLRDNPRPAQKALEDFLQEFGESPQALPATGYGADIVQVGQKLATAFAEHAAEQVRAFRANREKDTLLTIAERAVAEGRGLLEKLRRYRGNEEVQPADYEARFAAVLLDISQEQHRLAALAPWRNLAADPTDELIERYLQAMKTAGLSEDAEAKLLLAAAQKKLLSSVAFSSTLVPPRARRQPVNPPVLAAPVLAGTAIVKPGAETVPDVVFAVARGLLYALDAHTGELLWGDRVGPTTDDSRLLDLPLRVGQTDGDMDWVIVPSAGLESEKPGLTARRARTGASVWHQQLSSPCFGRPVLLAGSLFVPLTDPLGTILQINLATGEVIGQIALRQPIGAAIAAMPGARAGHGYLIVPADARRLFVFDVDRDDAEGKRTPMRLAAVVATGHVKDSILTEPVVVMGEDPAPERQVLLTLADSPTHMRLRLFPLPKLAELEQANEPLDVRPATVQETRVAGWSRFAPTTNGERIAVATDAGVLAVLGINQPGNQDRPLFPLAGPPSPPDSESIMRGQIVTSDEDSYWVIREGQLGRWKWALEPTRGPSFLAVGKPIAIGEPIARPQLRSASNLAYVVVRQGSSAIHMAAVDMSNGEIRWRRQLGIQAVHAPILQEDGSHLIVEDTGGVTRVQAHATEPGKTLSLTSITQPGTLTGAAVVLSPDKLDTWVVVPTTTADGPRLAVRKYRVGKMEGEVLVPVSERLAGRPLVLGTHLLLPLANGFLIRVSLADPQPQQGPSWRAGKPSADSVCHLALASADSFLATDGTNRILHWRWPADQPQAVRVAGPWELRDRIVLTPAVYTDAGKTRFAVAESSGSISVFDVQKVDEPLRKWRSQKDGPIVPGTPTLTLSAIRGSDGIRLLYAIDRRAVVCLDPNSAAPSWVNDNHTLDKLCAIDADDKRVLLTDRLGNVRIWNAATGKPSAETARTADSSLLRVGAAALGNDAALCPRSDGTITRVPLFPSASQ